MDDTMLLAPVAFFNRLQVTQVACGWSFTIALASDGAVYAWGAGGMGQLGRRNCLQTSTPKKVEGLEDHSVRLIACGENHAAVVTDAGNLLTWVMWQLYSIVVLHFEMPCVLTPQLCLLLLPGLWRAWAAWHGLL